MGEVQLVALAVGMLGRQRGGDAAARALLVDAEAARTLSRLADAGIALRGLFIIDPDGVVRYLCVHDNSIGRNTDETLRVLQALQTGEKCPLDWQPGEDTLG